jgi:phospholipid/cholesterol/gamma-HCH transport system substrate-binding protein
VVEQRVDEEDVAPPVQGHNRELWVGVFVIVGMLAVLGALFVFTDAATFRGRYIVTTLVPSAGGIRRGDPVQMRGVNIGRVQRFKIDKDNVAIRLEIEGEYPIPNDSRVELKSSGLLGGLIADIVPGSSSVESADGTVLAGRTETTFSEVSTKVTAQVEGALDRVERLISNQAIDDVHASTAELKALLKQLSTATGEQRKELAAISTSLRKSLESMERSSANLEKTSSAPEIERTLKRLDSLSARIDTASASLERSSGSLESVMLRIDKGEGTLGKLTRDDALYNNLTEAAANMTKLTEDIRKNPKRYMKLSLF